MLHKLYLKMVDSLLDSNVLVYDYLDSTNLEASRISGFVSKPTWILAYQQYSGLGRQGKKWISAWGNFSASLIFSPIGSMLELSHRSFLTALALRDTFIFLNVPSEVISFKWPNDILLEGKKVSGILLQTISGLHLKKFLVVGVGVNLKNFEKNSEYDEIEFQSSSLSKYICSPNPRNFLEILIQKFQFWETTFRKKGFCEIKRNWEIYGPKMGTEIRVKHGKFLSKGKYYGINDVGALKVEINKKMVEFPSAEIYF